MHDRRTEPANPATAFALRKSQIPMPKPFVFSLLAGFLMLSLFGCGDMATLPENAGTGPRPALPPPHPTLLPTVHIAPAKGWPAGATPVAAPGLAVNTYAAGLDHPRWLYVLPNGDVLVAETNGPPRPDDAGGIKGWVMKLLRKRAGGGVPSANRITLLRDMDGDGIAETRTVFLAGLNAPFGMTLVGSDLYVANTDSVMRFPYKPGDAQITAPGVKVVDLPAGTINHHWTKNIVASRDGLRLYVTVGSNSNVGEKAWGTRSIVLPSWRSISRPAARACSPRVCAIRTGWIGSPKAAHFGLRSMNATSLAAIWFPTL